MELMVGLINISMLMIIAQTAPAESHEPAQFSFSFALVLAFLIGAIAMMLFLSIWRQAGGKQFPYWVRMLLELPLGVAAAAVAFRSFHHSIKEFSYDDIGEAMIHTLFVVLAIELVRTAHRLQRAEVRLKDLSDFITGDERILIARNEPISNRREISVVAVERLDSGQLPQLLPLGPFGKWAVTISVLRVDRLQDLLFSPKYLKHFLTLHTSTQRQYRILIVNDKPRSEMAIRSFLQMSEQMPEQDRIRTYVYLKSEFYGMLDCVDRRLAPTKAKELRRIMEGQPDLSIMRDESALVEPLQMTSTDEYLLRFRQKTVQEFGSQLPNKLNIEYVDYVHRLMHAAIRENGREGLGNLDRVLKGSVTNPWKCDARLGFLKRTPRKQLADLPKNLPQEIASLTKK